ncbi:unnamed protein product [Mesocestoides corti]|uniref:Tektin n=1 Tax=Mesocestoides corti TaxID=53468 RepID=A0A0R3UFE6_MESCO|nr:unnamed protein product [Mesocestoides corti]
MSELIKPPKIFTPNEWFCSKQLKYKNADAVCKLAQNLDFECDRSIEEIKNRTDKTMEDVDKKLEQRIKNLNFWKSELENKLADIAKKSDALHSYIVRLKMALDATAEPLHISQQCIAVRNERKGIDLVADDPHNQLMREVELFTRIRTLLNRTIEQAIEQLRLNRKSAFNMKKDFLAKQTAQNLDKYAKSLSFGEHIPDELKCINPPGSSLSTAEWQAAVQRNLDEADRQVQNSNQMLSLIDGILLQVFNDQKQQVDSTNWAIKKRVSETRDTKRKLEEHLSIIFKEISDMEDNITEIKKALCDVKKTSTITGIRRNLRDCRPQTELCRDTPHYRILDQAIELQMDTDTLQKKLHEAEEGLKALCRRQLDLEEQIQIKSQSLHIEEAQVQGMRSSILIKHF